MVDMQKKNIKNLVMWKIWEDLKMVITQKQNINRNKKIGKPLKELLTSKKLIILWKFL